MRYAVIGASGHYNQVIEAVKFGFAGTPDAIAAGFEDENLSGITEITGAPVFSDWREMLDIVKPDTVVVNTVFGSNEVITRECLEKGINVYSEKPLACTFEGLQTIESAWRKSGAELGCMLNLSCCGWYRAIEQTVLNGDIGEVRLIHGQKSYRMGSRPAFFSARETYGGTIPWVGIHAIDWVLRLGSKCEWVTAVHTAEANRGNGSMESVGAVILQMEKGVIGTVDVDYFRPDGSARHDDDRLRVTGTRGMIEAINGRVWLENEEKRREVEVPEDINPFVRFINGFGTEENIRRAEQAIEDTRISLYARTAADAKTAIRIQENSL